MPCRAILDSASQLNLITSNLVENLQLKCSKASSTICGIGDGSIKGNISVDVDVKSRHSGFSATFNSMVVPSITNYQPTITFEPSEWKIPGNINLADPSFNKHCRIDLLIGAELFFDLMSIGQIKLTSHLPILQKTQLEWVLSGGGLINHGLWQSQ